MSKSESIDYAELVRQCDEHIRAGEGSLAAAMLRGLVLPRIPRQWRLPLAQVCRRVGYVAMGLRLLFPIVRADRKAAIEQPQPAEISEYALLLARNGAVTEAMELLSKIDVSQSPEASQSLGFCHCLRWEYALAIPHFRAYLNSHPSPYQELVTRVNLASALVTLGEVKEAHSILETNIESAKEQGYSRLLGNCYELRAQNHLSSGNYEACQADIEKAVECLGGADTRDLLFVRKWSAVVRSLRENNPSALLEFRAEAERRGHWESIREVDFFLLRIEFNQASYDRLLFGTPFEPYRQRVIQQLGKQPSETYWLGSPDAMCTLDILTGKISGAIGINPGKKTHQLIDILTRDLYRPLGLTSIFAELFPGEQFNIFSSPARVRMNLSRMRSWVEQKNIPLKLEYKSGYRLIPQAGFGIRLAFHRERVDHQHVQWRRFETEYAQGQEFVLAEAYKKLGMSCSTALRVVSWAVDEGHLERMGSGRSTRYRRIDPIAKKIPA